MNLVAKEFVATRQDQQGVLVLSELTGAATELGEALLVNPLDEIEIADQLRSALTMPPDEQQDRMAIMQQRIAAYDVKAWATDFLTNLQTTQTDHPPGPVMLDGTEKATMLKQYARAPSRLLLLDYDGTLAEFTDDPEQASPSPELIHQLTELAAIPNLHLLVISGRSQQTLEKWLGQLPIDLAAEHGASVRQEGTWTPMDQPDGIWKETIRPLLDDFVRRCDGSFVEEKENSLAWHYREASEPVGFERSRELVNLLEHLLSHSLRLLDGDKVIEVKTNLTDKGKVAKQAAAALKDAFIMAIGDDQTDEDMFSALSAMTPYTVKVGSQATMAQYRLDNVAQVLALLTDLAAQSEHLPARKKKK